jgi:hypothetical protein
MDIKKDRRDAASGLTVEGMYPSDKKGQGTAASDNNIGWDIRACSWARGADTDFAAIEKEKIEQDKRFGVPHEDNCPNPAASNGDADATLPNPHNFSSNPGFMGTSTGDMATMGNPAMKGGGDTFNTIRKVNRPMGTMMPAPGDVDSRSEGSPLVISSGYSG